MTLKIIGVVAAIILCTSGYSLADDKVAHKFCPVCGPEEEMEGLSFSYKYKDNKYSFCSIDCLKVFKKDPEKYLNVENSNSKEEVIHRDHDHNHHDKK